MKRMWAIELNIYRADDDCLTKEDRPILSTSYPWKSTLREALEQVDGKDELDSSIELIRQTTGEEISG